MHFCFVLFHGAVAKWYQMTSQIGVLFLVVQTLGGVLSKP